ncbi:MAG: signal peptide peptidase SppA [Steroidobacteraceae bacterium]|jgi:protease-4|nr:signal peptide peptidase SppA [Steroidobacteraceae bacterium]
MGVIGRLLRGLWHGLDGVRKVLHLVLLLVLFGLLFAALRDSVPYIPREAALVLAPQGQVVEELSSDPLDRALGRVSGGGHAESRLHDLVDVIDAAAGDDRVKALVLDLGSMEGAGLPKLQDMAAALGRFRESGKKVFAWGSYYDQRQYYLAAHADEVYLDPFGAVLIDGYGYYRQYLKGAADKLGVEVNVFRAGEFKSATDTYTRSDMSPEDREEASAWLGALWDGWKSDVAKARGLEPEALQAYADRAAEELGEVGGDLAQYALSRGLVDGLLTDEQFSERVAREAGTDPDTHGYRAVDWEPYLTVLRSEERILKAPDQSVAVVVAAGEILDGQQGPGRVGGETLAALLRELRHDDEVRAVVLRIDSPGGSMYASEVIRREVAALRSAGKPVVASMSSVAASGGYYIAAQADRILAAPATITGSIGVFMVLPTFETTLGKLGITYDGFGTTELSGAWRLERRLDPEFAAILESSVNDAYRKFLGVVSQGRERPIDEVDGIAQGRVWSGADAKAAGLVDEFGGLNEAVEVAAKLAGLDQDYGVTWPQPALTWQEALALRMRGSLGRGLDLLGLESPDLPLSPAGLMTRELRLLLELGQDGQPVYWCPCRVD